MEMGLLEQQIEIEKEMTQKAVNKYRNEFSQAVQGETFGTTPVANELMKAILSEYQTGISKYLDQYNAGLRVQQKDMIFDPVAPVEYIASTPQGETTIKYGDVTVVINGGSKEEIQSVLINVMRKAGYDVSNVPITA